MSVEDIKKEVSMMKLDKLIDEREGVSTKQLSIPEDELIDRYEKLYSGAVNDVLREFCLLDQSLPNYIMPLREYHTVAGYAFTVKSSPSTIVRGEMELRTRMLDAMHENSFVLWDTSNDLRSTSWGGVMTATAKRKKVKAACIDGGIRDTHQILDAEFPVFYKFRSSSGALGFRIITHYQIPIEIGNVMIKPGDIIVGDIDDVLVVPRDMAYNVLIRAEEILSNEKKIFKWVEEGQSAKDITDKGGYF